ncbi:hypothetical protein C7M84_020496 [Penaeus vannamei]|uniref:Uncharacterized protein n=1 Tax=Penaeus vannamei TaxID=6689 RepID=A0A423SBX6_PENVA|nr:hypothetical protein C7M84_020496 [Penaeus vannamei]
MHHSHSHDPIAPLTPITTPSVPLFPRRTPTRDVIHEPPSSSLQHNAHSTPIASAHVFLTVTPSRPHAHTSDHERCALTPHLRPRKLRPHAHTSDHERCALTPHTSDTNAAPSPTPPTTNAAPSEWSSTHRPCLTRLNSTPTPARSIMLQNLKKKTALVPPSLTSRTNQTKDEEEEEEEEVEEEEEEEEEEVVTVVVEVEVDVDLKVLEVEVFLTVVDLKVEVDLEEVEEVVTVLAVEVEPEVDAEVAPLISLATSSSCVWLTLKFVFQHFYTSSSCSLRVTLSRPLQDAAFQGVDKATRLFGKGGEKLTLGGAKKRASASLTPFSPRPGDLAGERGRGGKKSPTVTDVCPHNTYQTIFDLVSDLFLGGTTKPLKGREVTALHA